MSVWQEKQVRESNLLHSSVVIRNMFSLAVVLFVCMKKTSSKPSLVNYNFYL